MALSRPNSIKVLVTFPCGVYASNWTAQDYLRTILTRGFALSEAGIRLSSAETNALGSQFYFEITNPTALVPETKE